jgi:predicted transcriptional regulator
MKLSEIVGCLDFKQLNNEKVDLDIEITNGYASDLLSQVLRDAVPQSIWITIQNHLNIIGVAVTADLAAIIVCDGIQVPVEVIKKADEEGIAIFTCEQNAFQISGKLFECGIK